MALAPIETVRGRLPLHAGMTPGYSIRARLLLGAALVLVAFMAGAGLAVQRAHADSVRTSASAAGKAPTCCSRAPNSTTAARW